MRDAQVAEAQLRLELTQARDARWPGGAGGSQTFGSQADAWIERSRGRWSPKTLKETRYNLRRYILPKLGESRLDDITPAQIEAVYGWWTTGGFSASARRRWHGIIRAIFADAERLGELRAGPNPMVRVKPAGGRAPERRIPTPEEIRPHVAGAAPTVLIGVLFELAIASGARRGTLVALRWRDVNPRDRTQSPSVEAIAEGEDGFVFKENKGGRAYPVPITGRAPSSALRLQHRRAPGNCVCAWQALKDFGNLFVFSDDGGETHWALTWLSHAWRRALASSQVFRRYAPARRPALRAASQLLANGIPARVVAERLCARTEANVIRTYSHRVASPE